MTTGLVENIKAAAYNPSIGLEFCNSVEVNKTSTENSKDYKIVNLSAKQFLPENALEIVNHNQPISQLMLGSL